MQAEYEVKFHSMQQEMEQRQAEFKYTLDVMEESNYNINNVPSYLLWGTVTTITYM